jgi:hypothetical protein
MQKSQASIRRGSAWMSQHAPALKLFEAEVTSNAMTIIPHS